MGSITKTIRDEQGDRFRVASGGEILVESGGEITLESGSLLTQEDGVGAITTVTGLTLVERGVGAYQKTVFTFAATSTQAIEGSGTTGFAGLKLYDFPDGAIVVHGVLVDLAISAIAGSALSATADGDIGVGTVTATDNTTHQTGEDDILASTVIAQLSGGAGPVTGQDGGVLLPFDGTGTAKDLYLNWLFDDADVSGDDVITYGGTIAVFWMNLGDYT